MKEDGRKWKEITPIENTTPYLQTRFRAPEKNLKKQEEDIVEDLYNEEDEYQEDNEQPDDKDEHTNDKDDQKMDDEENIDPELDNFSE